MLSFYGAKKRLASLYPEPLLDVIIEPFCGSAAYSLYGDRWQKAIFLYDIDPRIVTVWDYLISATETDIKDLPMFGKGTCLDEFQQLSQPEKWFLGYMISAATRNPKKTATEKTNWNEKSQKRIAENIFKVHHWKVALSDFRKIPNQKATWFVDPPYQEAGKWYDFRLKNTEYTELRHFVEEREGQIIVCENIIAEWLDFSPLIEHKGQSNNRKVEGIFYRTSL